MIVVPWLKEKLLSKRSCGIEDDILNLVKIVFQMVSGHPAFDDDDSAPNII